MNVHSCNTRTKDINLYLNLVGNNIRENFITFQGIVLRNSLFMHFKLLASPAFFKNYVINYKFSKYVSLYNL